MNRRRSVRRHQDQQAEDIEIISEASDENPNGSSGSSGIPENRWHVRNSKNLVSPFDQQTVDNEEENRGNPSNRCQLEFTREVIARESSSSTQLSHASTTSQQSVLKTICSFSGLILLVILCIPKLFFKTCNSTIKNLTMKNLLFTVITVMISWVAIYCFCLYQKSTDVFASKELAKVYEDELKSLWKSQKALEEQFQEIVHLKHRTEHLRAEITSINESLMDSVKQILRESDIPGESKDEVLEMINVTFKKLYEDHVQMADWAQKTIGATIDRGKTSRTYEPKNGQDCWFKSFFISAANPPDTILQPDVYPGNCWAFHGSQGQVVIKLPERIHPNAVTVQHISVVVSPLNDVSSAPKDFSVYGIDAETDEETLLGTFMYDIKKETIQTFQLQNEAGKPFIYIKFEVQSNWGNMKFTCIYRVRVHGKMAEYLIASEEV